MGLEELIKKILGSNNYRAWKRKYNEAEKHRFASWAIWPWESGRTYERLYEEQWWAYQELSTNDKVRANKYMGRKA